ncbi:hypothetical protein M8542_46080 [Amycolatopsis sp. OK19-0408]|uniref:Uncharacterized protein n=1 Tax=Amycolatopsis iheyensis TaxID=2945988 RepID=A0A9X2NMG9_9PSEU|nr:hypothetical protein [Amycolatopsis iheyensis]MCR6490203.1 hypothetical protein [Amycolatopsis iheyensis]
MILRTYFDDGREMVEIEFLDVLGMKVKSYYDELVIGIAEDGSEIDNFIEVPERHEDRYMRLVVSDGGVGGFVVCGKVLIREE